MVVVVVVALVVAVVLVMMVTITTSATAPTIASAVMSAQVCTCRTVVSIPLSMASQSIHGPSSASQAALDEFIDRLHEELLEALHDIFQKAVNSRGVDKEHWFTVFWLLVELGRRAGYHFPLSSEISEPSLSYHLDLPSEVSEPSLSENSFLL